MRGKGGRGKAGGRRSPRGAPSEEEDDARRDHLIAQARVIMEHLEELRANEADQLRRTTERVIQARADLEESTRELRELNVSRLETRLTVADKKKEFEEDQASWAKEAQETLRQRMVTMQFLVHNALDFGITLGQGTGRRTLYLAYDVFVEGYGMRGCKYMFV